MNGKDAGFSPLYIHDTYRRQSRGEPTVSGFLIVLRGNQRARFLRR